MKKTPIVFVIDRATDQITDTVRPGQEWVLNGEGVATIKFDGQACRFQDGKLWKRYDRKLSKEAQWRLDRGQNVDASDLSNFRTPPEGFEPCEANPDPVTFHWPGWVPVDCNNPADKWHMEALNTLSEPLVEGATYELVGPSLAKNIYNLTKHQLWKHGKEHLEVGRSFEQIRDCLENLNAEGLVFHHPDGRMAKIRRKDFKMFWVQEEPVRRKKHKV